jgi:hypothetical protein
MYVMMHLTPVMTKSISLANDAGKPCNPIGVTLHWYLAPLPGGHGEGRVLSALLLERQLPEARSQIERRKYSQPSSKHCMTSLTQ